MSATVKLGTPVEVGLGASLSDIIKAVPQLQHIAQVGLIQRAIIVADNRRATLVRVTFVPKVMTNQHTL